MSTAVDRFLNTVTDTRISSADAFADEAVLDATVPGWRFEVHGRAHIEAQLGAWYADPGEFETLRRTPIEGGELVEFTLTWTEHGVPHAAHQAHILHVEGDRIVHDTAFCGGRWPASLLAQMEEARHAHV